VALVHLDPRGHPDINELELVVTTQGSGGSRGVGIVLAVVGLFYYPRMIRAAYLTDAGELAPPKPAFALRLVAIILCVAGTVGIGLWPAPLVDDAMRAGHDLLDERPVAATQQHDGKTEPARR
jgi:hypothetical protein